MTVTANVENALSTVGVTVPDADVEGTSRMAMVSVGDLNIELFEHHISRPDTPLPFTASGGNVLTFRRGGAARLIPSSS